MDVHKATIAISIAEDGRNGPARFLSVIPSQPDEIAKMAKRLGRHGELDFCYEAGGCGYNIYRQLTALGHSCTVVATSLIPRKPGERIKTDRRDPQRLAILHRSSDLTRVWVPDAAHQALRVLIRACVDASMHLMSARQQLLAFLLRHGQSYPTDKHWTQHHRFWLAGQSLVMPYSQWQYPRFFGYFPSNAALPAGILGDIANTGLGVLGLAWQSSLSFFIR
jgi:transposase